MTKKFVDWHTHTRFSDGLDDPRLVVKNSKLLGIESLAITDHDTLAGYREARTCADSWGIQLIPGVEVTTEVYHILGLNIDTSNWSFNEFLEKVTGLQNKVCQQRIKMLQKNGFNINWEYVRAIFPHLEQRLGKYNIFIAMLGDAGCRNLMRKKGFSTDNSSFNNLLGKDGIAGNIEKKYFVTSREAIDEIHKAGGMAIVAHPFKEAHTPKDLDILVGEGIDGLEIQPNYNVRNEEYEKYARQKRLLVTYGSDYHGSSFARPLLGRKDRGYDNKINVKGFFGGRNEHR